VTAPTHRRRGIGTEVLRHALQLAWDLDCYKVMLMTGRSNERTLQFYEKAGFIRGVKTGFVARPPDPKL
jgi:GNAT superfamily N-acetyltransferase